LRGEVAMTADREAHIRAAHRRLDAAVVAHVNARAEDNRLKTPATKKAREVAVTELELAARKVAALMATSYGL
jgi:hypothetical protein